MKMNYHLESKLATISYKFQLLEEELNSIGNMGQIWNTIAENYNGHPLQNLDEFIDDVKAERIELNFEL